MESFTGLNIRTRKLKIETIQPSKQASKFVFQKMFTDFQNSKIKSYKDEGIYDQS